MTSKTSPSRLEAVSSGPKSRKLSGFRSIDVAQERAEHPRRLAERRRRASARRPRSRGSRAAEVAEQLAAVRVRVGAHPPLAARAQRARARARGGRSRRTAPRAGSCAATPRAAAGAPALSRTSASGTWCERQVPSTGLPSTSFGPVQPFGVRRTIIGQRGRPGVPPLRARSRWISRDLVERRRRGRPRTRWCTGPGSSPVEAAGDDDRLPAVALEQRDQLLLGDPREHGRVRDLVAVQVQDRQHGAVACAG